MGLFPGGLLLLLLLLQATGNDRSGRCAHLQFAISSHISIHRYIQSWGAWPPLQKPALSFPAWAGEPRG